MRNQVATVILLTSLAFLAKPVAAADVDVRLSTREAYVGMPVTLQIAIQNAKDFQPPTIPQIDGCDIRSAGSPSESSQITIINGRRSSSRSVVMQYLITPRMEGSFEIPSFNVEIDGKNVSTPPQRFVVTKSVTGDLLFVEVAGGKNKVFVGQPLDLTLKIWIKPFRDAKRDLTLSEGDMWQTISDQTSWGGFSARMNELAENNQRPGGNEVLRDDGKGTERSYYLYEVEATVYPKRPGKIDTEDVQIIVNYPTELGKSRSPFGSFFDDDDAFGAFASPFRNRLAITKTRPIVGDVSVDATEVLPVPTEGRPADYRGAVGRYRIVTRATPTTVDAGDPITLNIGIIGTGPMELVQAPPLFEVPALTTDFKVADESLAGFVKDDSKVFSTTIRPRREGITQIPAIPFSFFDPETEKYETVMSDPISITVNKSETLALDAIVGRTRTRDNSTAITNATNAGNVPDFTNITSDTVLVSHSPVSQSRWSWLWIIMPPILWLATWFTVNRNSIRQRLPSLKSPLTRCKAAIERASDGDAIVLALTKYIADRSRKPSDSPNSSIGTLRVLGLYEIANQVESYFQTLDRDPANIDRERALSLLEKLEASMDSMSKARVRVPRQRLRKVMASTTTQRVLIGLVVAGSSMTTVGMAAESVNLSSAQQSIIFQEANGIYSRATSQSKTDSADAKEMFETAATKYQLLVDSGIKNGDLYFNLGNAYLQCGEIGHAIANYEHAKTIDAGNRQLITNLEFAKSRVAGEATPVTVPATSSIASIMQRLRDVNQIVLKFVGMRTMFSAMSIASILFWGLMISRTVGIQFPVWRLAAIPFLALIVTLGSVLLSESDKASELNSVIVANNVRLHAGDGDEFDEVVSKDISPGFRVEILERRGHWARIRTSGGNTGWVRANSVETIN